MLPANINGFQCDTYTDVSTADRYSVFNGLFFLDPLVTSDVYRDSKMLIIDYTE